MNRDKAKEVERKPRARKTPAADEAADCISWLLSQLPEKVKGLHPWHKRIVLMTTRQKRLNKDVRDEAEVRLFNKTLPKITEDGLKALETFYRPGKPKTFHELLSRRRNSPAVFMRNYIDQEDLAFQYVKKLKKTPTDIPVATELPEPTNWRERVPGNLGRVTWHQFCRDNYTMAKGLQDPLKDYAAEFEAGLKID